MDGELILAMIITGSILLGNCMEDVDFSVIIPGFVLLLIGIVTGLFYLSHWKK